MSWILWGWCCISLLYIRINCPKVLDMRDICIARKGD